MRLIDADALLQKGVWTVTAGDIKNAPTVDPVKHGKWIPIDERTAKCSLCGWWEITKGIDKTMTATIHRAVKRYCPSCGARMDGE